MASVHNTDAKIAILGAGSWGSALSVVFARHGKPVTLWAHDEKTAANLAGSRQITRPCQAELPPNVEVTDNLQKALDGAHIVLFASTAQSMREVSTKLQEYLEPANEKTNPPPVLVNGCKGLELATFSRMSQVLGETLPGMPICTLSGPNLAFEMVKGLPTAAVIASDSEAVAAFAQRHLSVLSYRLYTNDDICGVELAGALKNIYAIASGLCDGLCLGTNAKAALLTRALAEMRRFGEAHGAKAHTFAGLAGVGDLIATCTSPLSRNYQVGQKLSEGKSSELAVSELSEVAEGVPTCQAVHALCRKWEIEMPIVEQMQSTLKGHTQPKEALLNLLQRPLSHE